MNRKKNINLILKNSKIIGRLAPRDPLQFVTNNVIKDNEVVQLVNSDHVTQTTANERNPRYF